MERFSTEVWVLNGLTGSEPGVMTHENGVVALQLANDDDILVESFRVPVAEIADVRFPKMQMSGGCSMIVNGQKLRLSFLQPQNSRSPFASGQIAGAMSIGAGRKAGKAWKVLLGA